MEDLTFGVKYIFKYSILWYSVDTTSWTSALKAEANSIHFVKSPSKGRFKGGKWLACCDLPPKGLSCRSSTQLSPVWFGLWSWFLCLGRISESSILGVSRGVSLGCLSIGWNVSSGCLSNFSSSQFLDLFVVRVFLRIRPIYFVFRELCFQMRSCTKMMVL